MKKAKKKSGNEDQSFPGYPQYPATEDIVYRAKRVEMDLDGEGQSPAASDDTMSAADKKAQRAAHSPADVTKDDLQALNAGDNNFEGDDSVLEGRPYPVDFTGKDLDVPGSELDDRAEEIGEEDEENNLYSLGGENHEDLEEDRS